MTGRNWLLAIVSASVLAGSGCVSCGHEACKVVRGIGPDCEIPVCQRNQVYVFAIGGLNPAGMMALDRLREELNKQGFAKVATGQSIYTSWMADEMRNIRIDEPDAVFVIIGSDSGASSALQLAEKAKKAKMPGCGVVLIHTGAKTPLPASGPDRRIRTLTLRGYGSSAGSGGESHVVPDVSRYSLPADPRTVTAVSKLLTEVA